jgi:hypothetical protein
MTAIEIADLKNDTFYWGRVGANDRPHNRDTPDEGLLVKLTNQPHWLALYPEALNVGWHLSENDGLLKNFRLLDQYKDSHRGWWAQNVEVLRFYDDCCEQPVEELVLAKPDVAELQKELAEVKTRLTQAEQSRDQAWQNLDKFKERVTEVGGNYATAHDMCSVYDEIMEELGLPRRESEHSVTVRCHFTTTVTVMARSEEDAVDVVNENLMLVSYWRPPSMFVEHDMDSPWDLEFDTDV